MNVKFVQDFKEFAMRGNVIDLAVAVVIGTAFNKIVSSLVDNIIMPLAGIALGGISFANLKVTVGDAVVNYGVFIQAVIDFIIIAFTVFVAVKVINHFYKKEEAKPEKEKSTTPPKDIQLLTEIRDLLKRD